MARTRVPVTGTDLPQGPLSLAPLIEGAMADAPCNVAIDLTHSATVSPPWRRAGGQLYPIWSVRLA